MNFLEALKIVANSVVELAIHPFVEGGELKAFPKFLRGEWEVVGTDLMLANVTKNTSWLQPCVYLKTNAIPDTETWRRVIDAFVAEGAESFEGYGPDCIFDYTSLWPDYKYVGVDYLFRVVHMDCVESYSDGGAYDVYPVTLDFVLGGGKNDFRGIYLETKEIPDTKTWKKVIDAFVNAGAEHCDGYGPDCRNDYSDAWRDWKYIGVRCGNTYQTNDARAYSETGDLVSPVTLDFVLERAKSDE